MLLKTMTNKAQPWLLKEEGRKKSWWLFWTVFKRITPARALHNSLTAEGLVWQSMICGENGDRRIFANGSATVSLYSQEMLLLAALLSAFNIRTDFWPPVQVVKGGLCLCCSESAQIVCTSAMQCDRSWTSAGPHEIPRWPQIITIFFCAWFLVQFTVSGIVRTVLQPDRIVFS